MRITPILMMLLFTVSVYANISDNDTFLAKLDAAKVNYVYSDEGRLTILVTNESDKTILELAKDAPASLKVNLVSYKFEEENKKESE